MKIIVIGCGKVGSALARQLSEEGHDVSVIDRNPEVVNEVTSSCDVIGIVGNGGSHAVQKEVGIEDADLLIAASDSDELNLLSCLIAKKAGNCSTIARVRNPSYNSEIGFIREELGLSLTVNPEYAAAMEASRLLKFPSAIKIEPFARGHIELLKFPISGNSPIGGHTLAEVTKNIGGDVLVCAVERGPEHNVTIPDGLFRLQAGDILSIIAGPKSAHAFVEKAGLKRYEISNYAVPGQESLHNKVYWHYEPYAAFGVGACTFNGTERRTNTFDVREYIKSWNAAGAALHNSGLWQTEPLDRKTRLSEAMVMGLRLAEGISMNAMRKRFGIDVLQHYGKEVEMLRQNKMAVYDKERLRLTEYGMRYGNRAFEAFI